MMVEQLLEQRIAELEFRIQTLEHAMLSAGEHIVRLEKFLHAGTKRLLDDIFEEEERKNERSEH